MGSSEYTPDDAEAAVAPEPDSAPSGGYAPVGSPLAADAAGHDAFAEKPELYVGAAFAGGLVVAGLLRWIGNR